MVVAFCRFLSSVADVIFLCQTISFLFGHSQERSTWSWLHQDGQPTRCREMDADWLEIFAKARAERALSEHDATGNAVWRAVVRAAETYLRNAEQDGLRGTSAR